jgi:FAD binding domain
LWLDATGKRLPSPLYPGFDTLGTLEYIAQTGQDYTWFILNARIIAKEFALSGQEQNPDLTGRSVRDVLARVRPGAPAPVQAFVDRGVDFVSANSLRDLVAAMNTIPDVLPVDYSTVEAEVTARDREVANRFTKDIQVMSIRSARAYLGDRISRVVAPHRLTDPKAGPLIAVKLHILTRKSLGGLEPTSTPGSCGPTGPCSMVSTPRVRPPVSAVGECTATARWRGLSSVAACSPAVPRGGQPPATRPRIPRRGLKFRTLLRFEDLEVGIGHLGQPPVVDPAGVGLDDRLVDGHRARRRHRPQVVHGLRDPHPRRGGRSGEHVDRLLWREQRVTGMHESGRMIAVTDQIRNIVYHRDFRMNDGVPAADTAHGQVADAELVADMHRSPPLSELGCGLRIGVQSGLRVCLDQRG